MEQLDLNKRLLIAMVLSFIVFVAYSYIYPPVAPQLEQNQTTQPLTHATPNKHANAPTLASNATHPPKQSSQNENTIATIRSERFIIQIDQLGRIASMELLESKYRDDQGNNLQIIDPKAVRPLEIRFADTKLNQEAFTTPYVVEGSHEITLKKSAHTLTLRQNLNGLRVTKTITFEPDGSYVVDVDLSAKKRYFITPGYRPVADRSIYLLVRGALIKESDNTITVIEDGDAKGDEHFSKAKIASAFDRYHASVMYDFDHGLDISILQTNGEDPLIFIAKEGSASFKGYIGPKEYAVLKTLHPELIDVIEFGWFTFLAMPFFKVLHWIYDHIGNWGWAIVLFTLLVKAVLFPLSYKGMMSMNKLKDLAPKMKELREKYKNDPAKLNLKVMELYRKHNANPMGGCLPLLLQIPVFFALYRVLLNAVELQGAPWIGWIEDLSKMDPYYVLPILMGVSMWFQQRITPNNFTDPLQEKIFKWFPVIMTIFFITFPSGLVLYWLVSNLFTIAQQYYINAMYEKYKLAQKQANKK